MKYPATSTVGRLALFVLLLAGLSVPAHAQLTPRSVDQRIDESTVIVDGEVVGQEPFLDAETGMIYTLHRIRLFGQFKGAAAPAEIEVQTKGGVIAAYEEGEMRHHAVTVSHGLALQKGDVGLFFLDRATMQTPRAQLDGAIAHRPAEGAQSFVRYGASDQPVTDALHLIRETPAALRARVEARVGQPERQIRPRPVSVVARVVPKRASLRAQVAVPSISSFSPNPARGGRLEVLTINGTGFTNGAGGAASGSAATCFSNADNGGSNFICLAFDDLRVQAYSDTQIQIQVPKGAGTGPIAVRDNSGSLIQSGSDLNVEYSIASEIEYDQGDPALWDMYVSDLFDANGSGGYTFTMNDALAATSGATARVLESISDWRCDSGVNFDVVTSPTTTTTCDNRNDGINIVSFDDAACDLSGGTLGIAYQYFSGRDIGGTLAWRTVGLDVQFNRTVNWNYGTGGPAPGEFDFYSVALHEFGHTHGLAHLINPSASMHFSISAGTQKRSISGVESNGAAYMMSISTAANDPNEAVDPMTAVGGGACIIPVELVGWTAQADGQAVVLDWQTLTEVNNAGFEVEHRVADGVFETVAFVAGRGTTNEPQTYQHRLEDLEPGRHAFRLRQVDFDGTFEYSQALEVTVDVASAFYLSAAYPNPFNPQTQFSVAVPETQHVRVTVYDVLGRAVAVLLDEALPADAARDLYFEAATLTSGLYTFVVEGETFRATETAMLLK
ncbi:MAG: matrixin family metalloprotease [Bacteroidota bacterium]